MNSTSLLLFGKLFIAVACNVVELLLDNVVGIELVVKISFDVIACATATPIGESEIVVFEKFTFVCTGNRLVFVNSKLLELLAELGVLFFLLHVVFEFLLLLFIKLFIQFSSSPKFSSKSESSLQFTDLE